MLLKFHRYLVLSNADRMCSHPHKGAARGAKRSHQTRTLSRYVKVRHIRVWISVGQYGDLVLDDFGITISFVSERSTSSHGRLLDYVLAMFYQTRLRLLL